MPMRAIKQGSRYLLGAFMVFAGIMHFVITDFYASIVPPILPLPYVIVYVSGVIEIALGVLVLVPRLTRLAAWGIVALLVAVYPANIHMAINPHLYLDTMPTTFAHVFRLSLQFVFIGWAFWHTRPDPAANPTHQS